MAKKNRFCSVEFDEGGKSYYYLTENDTLAIGDFVFVPVGKDGRTAIVEIVNIEYFPEDKVPFPLEKVKRIIRKCTDDDFDLPIPPADSTASQSTVNCPATMTDSVISIEIGYLYRKSTFLLQETMRNK